MNRLRFTLAAAAVFASFATANAAPIFTSTTPGVTSVTLAAGTYDIVAVGASGGAILDDATHTAGFGAVFGGTFTFLSSTLLDILVGGVGGSQARYTTNAAGGGGGTFIVGASNTPLLIAGGGGGVGNGYSGGSARGIATSGGAGGSQAGPDPQFAGGGGGGLLGDGAGSFQGGGRAFVNGGAGGLDQYRGTGGGGVGGGGGAGLGGAGGGGYTGGSTSPMGGEGGTSFDAGLDPIFSLATFFGNGAVTITLVTPAATGVPEPESLALLAIGLLALVAPRRARQSGASLVPRARRPSSRKSLARLPTACWRPTNAGEKVSVSKRSPRTIDASLRKSMIKPIAVFLLALVSPIASATLVTIDDTFVVTNIANAPSLTITGAFKFTYDDAVASSGNIFGATISVPVSGSIAYAYDPTSPFFLTVYDTLNGDGVLGGTQDFVIRLASIFDAGPRFFYATPSSRIVSGGRIDVNPVTPSAVPEPASLGLFGLGLAAFALARRKRIAPRAA